jgi:hypothetical protein
MSYDRDLALALYQLQQYAGAARTAGASQTEMLQDAYDAISVGSPDRASRLDAIRALRERLLGTNGLLKRSQ